MPDSRDKRPWQFSLGAVFRLTVVIAVALASIRMLSVKSDTDRHSYLPPILGQLSVLDATTYVRFLVIIAMVACVSYLAKSRKMFLDGSIGALLAFIVAGIFLPPAMMSDYKEQPHADRLLACVIFSAVVACVIVAWRLRCHRNLSNK